MSLYTEYKKLTKEHKHSYILSLKEFNKVKYPQRLIKVIKENKAITYKKGEKLMDNYRQTFESYITKG